MESSSSEALEWRLLFGGGELSTGAGDAGRLCEGPGSAAEAEGADVIGLSTDGVLCLCVPIDDR